MSQNKFPLGWDEKRVKNVLSYYEHQTEEEAVAEDEAVYEQKDLSMVEIPCILLPKVRNLIADYYTEKQAA